MGIFCHRDGRVLGARNARIERAYNITMTLNVAIGPVPYVSGTRIHILNIVKYSRHNLNLIEYSPLSFYYPSYKGSGFLLRHKIPFIDPYGYYLAKKVLPKYDVIHTHGHPYWWDLYKKPRRCKGKYIHTVHQIYFKEDYSDKLWPWLNILNERLFQYCHDADFVTCVSKWVQQELQEHDIDSLVIPNGIDFEACENADASLFRKKYGIDCDFILFVGHTGKLKGADLFLELAQKLPDRLFVMCGHGTSDISVPTNVIGLGFLSHEDVLNAMAASRVIIIPSSKEAFSIVLLEALGCKRPIVATNSTGMKEIILDNKSGLLFDSDNFQDLYEKTCRAWDEPTLGIKGFKMVKERYDLKNIIKQIDKLYEEQK